MPVAHASRSEMQSRISIRLRQRGEGVSFTNMYLLSHFLSSALGTLLWIIVAALLVP